MAPYTKQTWKFRGIRWTMERMTINSFKVTSEYNYNGYFATFEDASLGIAQDIRDVFCLSHDAQVSLCEKIASEAKYLQFSK